MGYKPSGDKTNVEQIVDEALQQGKGVLRLGGGEKFGANWVPRSFCIPGRRIKLHPDDYYKMGGERGGIDERWFASTTPADNGPLTWDNEGMSFILYNDGTTVHRVMLKEAIEVRGKEIIGERLMRAYGKWMMYSKFFDNQEPLPHHIHHRDEHAKLTMDSEGKPNLGKPEAYYFPPQQNNHPGDRPETYFGLNPGTTKEQVHQCLMDFEKGDNGLLKLSSAQQLSPGTGWFVPAGVLHAPGSLCTYEPQKASDVFAMYQSVVGERRVVPKELLWKNTSAELIGTKEGIDYLMGVIDWDKNVDPNFVQKYFMSPKPVRDLEQMKAEGYIEMWITYKTDDFSAKELTVLPGQTVTIKDSAAYGFITMQGHGRFGVWNINSPNMIYFGQDTYDEFFVTEDAAKKGVRIHNPDASEPLVLLKHSGPKNPDLVTDEVVKRIPIPRDYVGNLVRRLAT